MDVFIAIVAGLAFRLFLSNLDGPLTPALLGLCEGALVHYLPNRHSLLDHYLAYGLRIVVDLFFTENISRMMLVLLWTALTFVASDALSPLSHRGSKRSRRHAAHTVTRTPLPQQLATPAPLNPRPLNPILTHTPVHNPPYDLGRLPGTSLQLPNGPSRPPSPPSFFLEGESETNIISPTSEQRLEYVPEPDSLSNSSSPRHILLPTPATLIADHQQGDALSDHRLSTIQELSGDDNTDVWTEVDHARPPGAHTFFDKPTTSYPPSVATPAPLPVPDPTFIRADWARTVNLNNDDSDPLNSPTLSTSPPLPVPNAAIWPQQAERKIDLSSESDELRTPGAHHGHLTDQDELRTPSGHQKVLSPLFSDQPLPAGFGITGEGQSAVDDIAPLSIPVVNPGVPNSPITVTSTLLNSSVEFFPKVVNDQIPDLDKLSDAETLETEADATSVISPGTSSQLFSRAEFFRQQAWTKEKERVDLDNELKGALNEARIKDTLFLREKIRVSEARAKKLHEKAARRYIKARNSLPSSAHKIDVHGLRVVEAINLTEKALRDALTHGYPDIKVIVGKGIHSRNGIPVLKSAIIRHMQTCKIPCRVDPFNPGILILSLPSQ